MTTAGAVGSILLAPIFLVGYARAGGGAAGETCLGIADKGIFGDLDAKVQLALPSGLYLSRLKAGPEVVTRKMLVLP